MPEKKPIYLTKEGYEKLENKLEYLTNSKRIEVAERIGAAIALGDLSENSEYEDSKNEQAFMEGEILTITATLRRAEIIDNSSIAGDTVVLGAVIHIKDTTNNNEFEYTIVGSGEADPFDGKISNESPIGVALLGKHIGEIVKYHSPSGKKEVQITAIHR
ncbi:MAG: transcription elongation factor GreA [Clostridiales bacterium]|nr:transcription elongation factor GreA [Clostridiales bacterium]